MKMQSERLGLQQVETRMEDGGVTVSRGRAPGELGKLGKLNTFGALAVLAPRGSNWVLGALWDLHPP